MWSSWEPEEDFLFVDAKEDLKRRREEGAKGKGREDDEEEEMEGFDEDEDRSYTEERTSGKLPNLPTVGRWLDSEDDALARFLLPLENYTRRDQNGRDAFDRFARTEHTRRSGAACREHHRNWKDKFDSRMDLLRGGNGKGRAKEESKQWDGERKGKEKQVSKRAQTFSNTESARPPRPTYTDQEESHFQTCLKTSRTSLEAAEKMFALHPRRNVLSIEHRYRRKISEYQDLLGSGDATGTPTVASEFSSNLNPSRKHQHQHQQQPQSSTSTPIHHSQNQTPLDSDSDSEFEPPSFLQLGVAPSSLPSSSPFCFWCGTGEEESEYFRALGLAEQDPSSSQGFRRVEGRVACSFCFERMERWMARGDGSGREIEELEKLDWVRKKLEEVGRRERASLVRRRDGGTAAEG